MLEKRNGRFTGQALVLLRSRADVEEAKRVLHSQWMGTRFVEVLDPSDLGREWEGRQNRDEEPQPHSERI